jgi:hypothetical protein
LEMAYRTSFSKWEIRKTFVLFERLSDIQPNFTIAGLVPLAAR